MLNSGREKLNKGFASAAADANGFKLGSLRHGQAGLSRAC